MSSAVAPATRASARTSARVPTRVTRLEPHEKYTIPESEWPPGLQPQWCALTVMGQVNRGHMINLHQNGWVPARAEQFPRHSGYGVSLEESHIPIGYDDKGKPLFLESVKAGDPIVKDGQILMLAPREQVEEQTALIEQKSKDQVRDQIDRLRGQSRREVGDKLTKASSQFSANVDE